MFKVEGDKITISKGDTGALTIHATNATFTVNDRAVFTIAPRGSGDPIFEQEYPLTNASFTVSLTNEVTDKWTPGNYKWQVRYVWDPVYDQTTGKISGGSKVKTPWEDKDFVVQKVLSDF